MQYVRIDRYTKLKSSLEDFDNNVASLMFSRLKRLQFWTRRHEKTPRPDISPND